MAMLIPDGKFKTKKKKNTTPPPLEIKKKHSLMIINPSRRYKKYKHI